MGVAVCSWFVVGRSVLVVVCCLYLLFVGVVCCLLYVAGCLLSVV